MIRWMSGRSAPAWWATLPPLRGWALRSYTLVWIAALALAVAATGLNTWQGLKPFEYTYGGYGLGGNETGRGIIFVTGAEAIAQGIKPGATLLAIDGVPTADIGADWFSLRKALIRQEGQTIALTLRDQEGQVRTHRLTRSAANTIGAERTRSLGIAMNLLGGVAFLSAAMLLFRRRHEAVPAILALAFPLGMAALNNEASIWLDRTWLASGLGRLSMVGYMLMLFGLLVFPDGRMSRIAWVITGAIAIFTLSMFMMPLERLGVVYPPVFLILLAMVLARQLLRYRQMPQGSTRQQVRWGIFGFASGGILLMISGGLYIATEQTGGPAVYQLQMGSDVAGTLATLCMAGGLLVSLMRYRLYDADAVIGRSAAYGVLTLGFVALFAGSQKVIEALGETYFGGQLGALAGALGAAVAAVLIVPLHRRVNNWAERRFQKALLGLRRGLPDLVGDLRETAAPDRIAETVAEAAIVGVQATRAAVLVGDTMVAARGVSPERAAGWLEERGSPAVSAREARRDPLFPMQLALDAHGTGLVGWLLLGPRPDGSFYGRDEREALTEIAEPVARALAIAGARESEKRDLQTAFDRLESRIKSLEAGGRRRRGGSAALAGAA